MSENKECMTHGDANDAVKAMRQMTGDDSVQPIGIDDSFGFKCQQCGACCMHRNDIILNPFDVFNGARYLGITCDEFLNNYCHIDLGCNSKIPMVLLRSGENGFCPLLKLDIKDGGKFKCMIHAAKPGACSNHPIGVAYSTNKTTGETGTSFVKVSQCENSVSDEQHTVREWVQPYMDHIDEINQAHILQHLVTDYFDPREFFMFCQTLMFVVRAKSKDIAETDHNDDEMQRGAEEIFQNYVYTTIGLGYAEYDTSQDFIPQAEENLKKLADFYEKTKELYDALQPKTKNIQNMVGEALVSKIMEMVGMGKEEEQEGEE